jgi:GNAT superfamily N-acetyltransferase
MHKIDFNIREMEKTDFENYFKLKYEFCEYHLEYEEQSPSIVIDIKIPESDEEKKIFVRRFGKVAKNKAKFLVAESEGKIVGFIFGFLEDVERTGNIFLYIDEFYLVEDFRSKGIGKALEKGITDWALENEVYWSGLHVLISNDNSVKAYENMGYNPQSYFMAKKINED